MDCRDTILFLRTDLWCLGPDQNTRTGYKIRSLGKVYNQMSLEQHLTAQTLKEKVDALKLQLSCSLDKSMKLSEFAERERFVDQITGFKRDLQQLKLKLEKEHQPQPAFRVFSKIVLKVNALQNELNLKQSKHLWNKENRRRQPKDNQYQDLMQQLVDKDNKIKCMTTQLASIRRENQNLKDQFEELQLNLKVILTQQNQTLTTRQDLQTESQQLKIRVRQLQGQNIKQVVIISRLKELETENLHVYQKGAQQIHRLSKLLSLEGQRAEQLEDGVRLKAEAILMLESQLKTQLQKERQQLDLANQQRQSLKEKDVRLTIQSQQISCLQLSNDQGTRENLRMQEGCTVSEEVLKRTHHEIGALKVANEYALQALKNRYDQQLAATGIVIQSMTKEIGCLKEQLEYSHNLSNQMSLKHQEESIRMEQQTLSWAALYREMDASNQQLSLQRESMREELDGLNSSYQQLSSRNYQERIVELSAKVAASVGEADRLRAQLKHLKRQNEQVARENKLSELKILQIQNQNRMGTAEIGLVKDMLERERSRSGLTQSKLRQIIQQTQQEMQSLEQKASSLTLQISRLTTQNQALALENQDLVSQLQHSHRLFRQTEADNLIQYQQEVKHNLIIQGLVGQITNLETTKHDNQLRIQELLSRIQHHQGTSQVMSQQMSTSKARYVQGSTVNLHSLDKSGVKSLNEFGSCSRLNKSSKEIKIKVLEDIRKIIDTME